MLDNSILSANKANGGFNDTYGPILKSSANNLIGVGGSLTNGVNGNKLGITSPKLLPLGNYGGPTQTMLPMAGSPVIDAGSNALIPSGITTDQRGMPRIFGKSVDIGADEYISITLSGSVFNDKNGDGIRQSTDPALFNWQVYIDLNNVGYVVAGDPVATTNSLGNYTLTFLPTGTKPLIVREVRQNNWRRTKPAGIYPLGYYTVSPIAGAAAKLDFGNSATALVTGTVFKDTNANGKLGTSESGLAAWTVQVDYLSSSGWQNNITLGTGATLTGENFGNK